MTLKYLFLIILLSILNLGCKNSKDIEHRITMSSDFQTAQEAYFNGNYNLSIEYYSKLISEYPDVVWLYMNRGDAYSDNGNVKDAIKDYNYVINQNENHKGQALLKSGLTYFYADDFKNAKITFNNITTLEPKQFSNEIWSSYYHLGQIAYKTGHFEYAISLYNKADKYTQTLLTNYHKANAFYSLGLLDSADVNFKKSITFVKSNFIEMYPESAIAKCDKCGFSFGSIEYELLTIPTKEGHMHTMKKLFENEIIQDVINNPKKYLDTNYIKKSDKIYLIR
jgi:tetratricopeptide (TPR) repeat protein